MAGDLDRQYKLGSDVTELIRPEKQPMAVLSVRVSPEELSGLQAMADAKGRTVSQIARQAVIAYLAVADWGSSYSQFSIASQHFSASFTSGPQESTGGTASEFRDSIPA